MLESAIVNLRRRKQIKEFFDSNSDARSKYYSLLDENLSSKKLKESMTKLIEQDPDFYDSYEVVADILIDEGEVQEALKILYQGFQRAMKRIVDREGNFPEKIEWGWLENRHVVRIINRWALELWDQGKPQEALEILRKILKSNPNDNIGVRYSILAINLGLKSDFEEKFEHKENPDYLNAADLIDWFYKHFRKFPDEFAWWYKIVDGEDITKTK